MQMKAVFYGHKDKNEKELDMRKNRKNNSHTYRKRICIMAVLCWEVCSKERESGRQRIAGDCHWNGLF